MLREIVSEKALRADQLFHGDVLSGQIKESSEDSEEVLDFSTNVFPLGPPDSVVESLKDDVRKISDYPPHQPEGLREDIANYSEANKEEVVIGNGANELIHLLSRVFIDPGDRAVIVDPTFTEYSKSVKNQGGMIKSIGLEEERGFSLNTDKVSDQIDDDVKLVFLCSPNNPTGRMVSLEDLRDILIECRSHGAGLVLDEAFYEFCDNKNHFNVAEMDLDHLISVRSLTKFYSLPGLRFGYMIVPSDISEIFYNNQVRWNVNVLAQIAAKEAISDEGYMEKVKKVTQDAKSFLFREIKEFDELKIYPSDANFFLLKLSKMELTSHELVEKLLDKRILIRSCHDFKFLDENFVRVNVSRKENCEKLVKALDEIFS